MIMCLSTKGYCFQEQWAIVLSIVFLFFCNLKILKQGIEMQIFFLNGLWRFLKNGNLPVKLHSSDPPGDEASSLSDVRVSTCRFIACEGFIPLLS